MTFHKWGDKDFNWDGLYDAEKIIYFWACKVGRVGGQLKEKFGTLRFHSQFSDGTLHSLVYPGWCSIQWRWFYWNVDYPILQKIARYTGTLYLIHRYQAFWYRFAYKKAVKKHPHLVSEILCDAGHQNLIEGIGGYKHNDHWTTFSSKD